MRKKRGDAMKKRQKNLLGIHIFPIFAAEQSI